MKRASEPRPFRTRLRRFLRWPALVLIALFAATWVFSVLWTAQVSTYSTPVPVGAQIEVSGWTVAVARGGLTVIWGKASYTQAQFDQAMSVRGTQAYKFHVEQGNPAHSNWWFVIDPASASPSVPGWVFIPLWFPLLLSVLTAFALFYPDLRRRIPPGHCTRCGYDMRSLCIQSSPGGGGCRVREAGGGSHSDSVICPECGSKVIPS